MLHIQKLHLLERCYLIPVAACKQGVENLGS